MKIQLTKLFLASALSLAVAASCIGSSTTAQAAGNEVASPLWTCDHYWYYYGHSSTYYESFSSEYHEVYEMGTYKCSICGNFSVRREGQSSYEKHDLHASDSPHRFKCILCEYEE